ncbi:MAG: RluA family pseudouridine synthase, partial [Lachnospiraceae bacterium]|nr:RluA family pseudouridine synthase [Lachnospiraceae bacterium]
MERIVSYTASKKEDGKTISAYLKELGFSAGQIGRMKFRKDGICLNGERARVNRVLKEGDLLSLQLMDRGEDIREGTDRAPAPGKVVWADPAPEVGPLQVLYEDPDILAVHKRAGLVCHPSPGHYADTLANAAAFYLKGQGITGRLFLLGRLDRDTSGIVIFAKHPEAAAMLGDQRKKGTFEKIYLAEVRGGFEKEEEVIDRPLRRIRDTMHMEVSDEGKEA